jgi:ribosomal protein S1
MVHHNNSVRNSFADIFFNTSINFVDLKECLIRTPAPYSLKKNVSYVVDIGLKNPILVDSSFKSTNKKTEIFHIDSIDIKENSVYLSSYQESSTNYLLTNELWNYLVTNKSYINGVILNTIKGGYSVGIAGIVAFLPLNQYLPVNNSYGFIGKRKTFSVLNINTEKQNVVLSRKKALILRSFQIYD